MGITKKELLANCSPDTLALSAAALAELDGERTITAELRNTGALGVDVDAPQPVAQSIPRRIATGAMAPTACTSARRQRTTRPASSGRLCTST